MKRAVAKATKNLVPSENAADLEAMLRTRLWRLVKGFRLESVDQGFILRGNADSYYDKQLAQQAVMEATARRIVANEIEVARSDQRERQSAIR